MLFLLGLSCLAAKITLTTDKGNKFAFNVKQVEDRQIMVSEVENSSVFVLGADGRRLYEGSFAGAGAGSGAAPQTVNIAEADSTDFSKANIETRKWNGERVDPVQIEIFGTVTCPYCVQAKALALKTFGVEKTKAYDYNDPNYAQRSEKIMNDAGIYNYAYIPRVSVIAMIDNKLARFVLGGFSEFSQFVNKMNQNRTGKFNQTRQRVATSGGQPAGIWGRWK